MPDANDDVTIPNTANNPGINANVNAVALSITVEADAALTVFVDGSLSIDGDGAGDAAINLIGNNSTFTNNGTLTIGATNSVGLYGIRLAPGSRFNNIGLGGLSGQTHIDGSTTAAIHNEGRVDHLLGSITIGANSSVGDYGIYNLGIYNSERFLNIDRSTTAAIYNEDDFDISAETTIGANSSVGTYGIRNATGGDFKINNGSYEVHIDRSTTAAINNEGVFNNLATITIGANAGVGATGIISSAQFQAGTINIDNATSTAIDVVADNFFANKHITIGQLGAIPQLVGGSGGDFRHFTNSTLKGTGAVKAAIYTSFGGQLSPGNSPGIITFDGSEDLSTATLDMEIDGNAGAGNMGGHDQIVVNGTATFGGTSVLDVDFGSFTPTVGQTFTIVDATTVTGTFATINVTPATFIVSHSNGVLTFNGFNATTWTGASDTDWASPANWTNSVVPAAVTDVTIPDVANDPVIPAGTNAQAKSVLVGAGASLTIATGASLSIDADGTANGAIENNGTVANSGTITLGATSSIGLYGIDNNNDFSNHTGAVIHIDRSTQRAIDHSSGTFTNAGTINIGANASVGSRGIQNGGTFDNQAGGQINMDNVFLGVSTFSNFNNSGTMTFGQSSPVTTLIRRNGSLERFFNKPGGTVKGTGTIKAATFKDEGGTLSPGHSPGILTFDAGEDFSTATLDMEIEGTAGAGNPGGHDQIVVSGTATLGGSSVLNVDFGSFTPSGGQTFTIISATSVSGTFATVNFPTLPGLSFTASYMATSVTVNVQTALPVELVGFSAKENNGTVLLDWVTASETDNEGFDIERSTDGRTWQAIGFVAGHGTTVGARSYFFEDEKPLSPHLGGCKGGCMNYYRLRQMDFDGTLEYSKVVSVDMTNLGGLSYLQAYPNPAPHGSLTVNFPVEMEGGTLTLFGPSGQMVLQKTVGGGQALLDLSGLSGGMYLVRLTDGQSSWREQVVVQ